MSADPEFVDWRTTARCATATADHFILEKGQSTKAAKALCAECPSVRACLDYAIESGQRRGVWGGLTVREIKARQRVAS